MISSFIVFPDVVEVDAVVVASGDLRELPGRSVGPDPGLSVEYLSEHLNGSIPYTTRWDVNCLRSIARRPRYSYEEPTTPRTADREASNIVIDGL